MLGICELLLLVILFNTLPSMVVPESVATGLFTDRMLLLVVDKPKHRC